MIKQVKNKFLQLHSFIFGYMRFRDLLILLIISISVIILFDYFFITACRGTTNSHPICTVLGEKFNIWQTLNSEGTTFEKDMPFHLLTRWHHVIVFLIIFFLVRWHKHVKNKSDIALWEWWKYSLIFTFYLIYKMSYLIILGKMIDYVTFIPLWGY